MMPKGGIYTVLCVFVRGNIWGSNRISSLLFVFGNFFQVEQCMGKQVRVNESRGTMNNVGLVYSLSSSKWGKLLFDVLMI